MQQESFEARAGELEALLLRYASPGELAPVRDALARARARWEGRRWVDGRPYVLHPVETALTLAAMQQDIPTILAALSHDCPCAAAGADGAAAAPDEAGKETRELLLGLRRLHDIERRSQRIEQPGNLRRMILAEARDIRTLLLLLADHLRVMEGLAALPPDGRERLLELCTKVYAPLAGRLGIHRIKSRLEDLSFRAVSPPAYAALVDAISRSSGARESYIERVRGVISSMLAERGVEAQVLGRVKHVFSIHQKMLRQNVTVEGLYDIVAFRVLVDTEQRCWEVLGVIHGRWAPLPGRFRDFISLPKKNGYRSLHTSVLGPKKERIEIQIRTHAMHRLAEEGVAAHWRYKEKEATRASPAEERQLAAILSSAGDEEQADAAGEASAEIYVFTPAGAVLALPRGATCLDFAYAVHTGVGHRCAGAFVNGAMAALSHELASGDLVRIVTRQGQHPTPGWLEMARSPRARSKIRAYLGTLKRQEEIGRGRGALERFLRERGASLQKLEKRGRIREAAEKLHATSVEELYLRVHAGRLDPDEVAKILFPTAEKARPPGDEEPAERKEAPRRDSKEIVLGEIGNMLVRFAGCCNPLPGDEIRGFITRGRGVTIHRRSCPNMTGADPDRRVEISWNIARDVKVRAVLRIDTQDAPGALARLTHAIAARGLQISAARSVRAGPDLLANTFTVEVAGAEELRVLVRALERVAGVKKVARI